MEFFQPRDEQDLSSFIERAHNNRVPVEIRGSGSKAAIGRPVQVKHALSSLNISGILFYEPRERVMSAKAGTPLKFIEETLAYNGQMLPFEPVNFAMINQKPEEQGTIGGVFASHVDGSRRILAGSAQDHFLGMNAVNGMGKRFKAGGRVMKNVAGYDICRSVAGSWGTLVIMTDVTFRVMPKPETTKTLIFYDLLDVLAIELMGKAMKTPYEISGAAHLPSSLVSNLTDSDLNTRGKAITALRLENFSYAVSNRLDKLQEILGSFAAMDILDKDKSLTFWSDVRNLNFFKSSDAPFWRITTAPSKAVEIVASIRAHHPECVAAYDWAGGLIWLLTPYRADAGASEVHRTVLNRSGNATLMRGSSELRNSTYVFQPLERNMKALVKKVKHAFDPAGILNPGKMYSDI